MTLIYGSCLQGYEFGDLQGFLHPQSYEEINGQEGNAKPAPVVCRAPHCIHTSPELVAVADVLISALKSGLRRHLLPVNTHVAFTRTHKHAKLLLRFQKKLH